MSIESGVRVEGSLKRLSSAPNEGMEKTFTSFIFI